MFVTSVTAASRPAFGIAVRVPDTTQSPKYAPWEVAQLPSKVRRRFVRHEAMQDLAQQEIRKPGSVLGKHPLPEKALRFIKRQVRKARLAVGQLNATFDKPRRKAAREEAQRLRIQAEAQKQHNLAYVASLRSSLSRLQQQADGYRLRADRYEPSNSIYRYYLDEAKSVERRIESARLEIAQLSR